MECARYVYQVIPEPTEEVKLNQEIRVVKEFMDVFAEELLGMCQTRVHGTVHVAYFS
jgi:hypothetical protein